MKLSELTIPEVSDCDAQIEPMGAKVLVVPAEIPEKVGSIILTGETHEKKEYANQRGRIVAVGPCAFVFDDWPKDHPPPQVGDVILHEAYIGDTVEGEDGKKYRLMNDRAVTAVLKREAAVMKLEVVNG